MNIQKIVEVKKGNAWTETFRTSEPAYVYESLANDLIAKKINACAYIRSIKRENLYTGFQRVTVNYNNGVRTIYTVRSL